MIPTDMARDGTPWVVLYDQDCGFCRWSLSWVLKADRCRCIEPVALGSEQADALLADMPPEERDASWHLAAPDGRRWSAGYAAPPLLRLLPGGRLPACMLGAAPELTDRAYRWIAEHRSALSKVLPVRSKERADRVINARRAAPR